MNQNKRLYRVRTAKQDLLRYGSSIKEVRQWAAGAFRAEHARVTPESSTPFCDGCDSRPCVCERQPGCIRNRA